MVQIHDTQPEEKKATIFFTYTHSTQTLDIETSNTTMSGSFCISKTIDSSKIGTYYVHPSTFASTIITPEENTSLSIERLIESFDANAVSDEILMFILFFVVVLYTVKFVMDERDVYTFAIDLREI